MNENSENKKSEGGNGSSEVQMRMALHEIIRLVEGWEGSDKERLKVFLEGVWTTKEFVEFSRQNGKDSQSDLT